MKKLLLEKVLAALIIFAASSYFVNLQGQVSISFMNDSAEIGHSATGTIAPLTLNFKISDAGVISLDAFSESADTLVAAVVNRWDSDSVGSTDIASLFGYSFSLVATSGTDRLQCGWAESGPFGGLGVQGKNQRRIDDGGTESLNFELIGEVGLEFTSIAYNDVNTGVGNIANLRFIDYDSDETYFITKPVLTNDTVYTLPAGEITMRNSLDMLTVTNSDTISTSDGNEGARLFGLDFNVVEAAPKPLPVGQIAVTFSNDPALRVGGTATGGLNPLSLDFTIDDAGIISLDASTGNEDSLVNIVVNSWDSDSLGVTDNATLFGQTFSLMVDPPNRVQCDAEGGLGVQGRNQWRIDDGVAKDEQITFELSGEVGLEFISFKYNSLASGADDMGHLRFIDNNSDETYMLKKPGLFPFSEFTLPVGDIEMRYKTDLVTVTLNDTIGNGDEGARLYGLVLNVTEPILKPPVVSETAPADGDTLVPVNADYVLTFDTEMDKATTPGAISFSPDVTNRTDAWNEAGTVLTISFDDLMIYEEYVVTVGTGILSAKGKYAEAEAVFTFQTLPDPPTVVNTYPVTLGKQVPLNTPLAVEFSRSMMPDSVEKAISFEPELTGLGFVWNEDNSMVYMISDEMVSTIYVVTIGADATDAYGLQLAEPFTFEFNTWPVSAKDIKISDVVLYPNPATDMLHIRGIDVASVKIHNLAGQLIKEINNSSVVNVSDIDPGSYFITVSDNEDNRIRKMIVVE